MTTFQKLSLLTATLLLGSASTLADVADDVKSAARKLADAASYSWTATTEIEGGNGPRLQCRAKPSRVEQP